MRKERWLKGRGSGVLHPCGSTRICPRRLMCPPQCGVALPHIVRGRCTHVGSVRKVIPLWDTDTFHRLVILCWCCPRSQHHPGATRPLVPPVGLEPTSRGIQVLYPFTHRSSAFELWRHIRGGYKTTNSIYSCTLARLCRLRGIGL